MMRETSALHQYVRVESPAADRSGLQARRQAKVESFSRALLLLFCVLVVVTRLRTRSWSSLLEGGTLSIVSVKRAGKYGLNCRCRFFAPTPKS